MTKRFSVEDWAADDEEKGVYFRIVDTLAPKEERDKVVGYVDTYPYKWHAWFNGWSGFTFLNGETDQDFDSLEAAIDAVESVTRKGDMQ